MGLSEVVLTFDNRDGSGPPQLAAFAEIQIARRLYRSGESEYLINKVPCRLRDVYDFFRDTGIGTKGYTIVEQGQIALIVSAKPEERRALIEEAKVLRPARDDACMCWHHLCMNTCPRCSSVQARSAELANYLHASMSATSFICRSLILVFSPTNT